jgi:PAS domain S-box-containing protein|tara:strand:- start:13782 stop:16349 length:2568 start_codon:yes stop_codon:yes gene_type:complete
VLKDSFKSGSAEKELKESKTKFRLLAESTLAFITITRGDKVLFANSSWEKISGYSREEILKVKYSKMVHPDMLEMVREQGLASLRGEKVPSRYELKILTKNRQVRWLDLSVVKFSYMGKPALLSSAFDITDRKRLENKIKKEKDEREQRVRQALRESEEKYMQMFNTVPAGIMLYDAETKKLLDGNKAALNLYGYSKEEFLDLTYWDITAEPEKSKETFPRVLSGEVKRIPLRYQKKKDGTVIPIEASVGSFRLNNRKVICGVSTDISEHRQAQEELEKANQKLRNEIKNRERAEILLRAQNYLAMTLSAMSDLKKRLEICLTTALQISGMDSGWIYLVDAISPTLDLAVHMGLSPDFVKSVSHYSSASPLTKMVLTGKPIYSRYDELNLPKKTTKQSEGLRAFAVIPMRHENRIIGCLNLASHDKNSVPVFSRHALESIAAQLGISIARIRAEEAMRKSEERYRILFEQDPDAIILSDMKDRIIDVNPNARKLTGYTRDELVNMKVTDFLTQELRRKKGEVFSHTIEKYQGLPFDGLNIHKDGTRIPVEIKTVFLAIEGLILAIVRDITERKKGEQALRKSEEKHRVLIETMNEGLLVQDKNDAITYINNKMAEMLGYSKDEMTGRKATDFNEDTDLRIAKKHRGRQKKEDQKSHEMKWKCKNGRKIYTIVSPQAFFDEKNRSKGGFAVVTNITKLKQTEQKLRKRENELEIKTENLNEMNTALKVLLKTRDEDKIELEERVLYNVKELIEPYLKKFKNSGLKGRQKVLFEILESNLKDIISPFSRRMTSTFLRLTPKELQIANMIKQGKTSKEIADLMGISSRTIETHRKNLRDKIGIGNKKVNLRTHLLSIH